MATASAPMEQSAASHPAPAAAPDGLAVGERRGRQAIYPLHDPHVADLLVQAVFHADHLRVGAGAPVEREEAS